MLRLVSICINSHIKTKKTVSLISSALWLYCSSVVQIRIVTRLNLQHFLLPVLELMYGYYFRKIWNTSLQILFLSHIIPFQKFWWFRHDITKMVWCRLLPIILDAFIVFCESCDSFHLIKWKGKYPIYYEIEAPGMASTSLFTCSRWCMEEASCVLLSWSLGFMLAGRALWDSKCERKGVRPQGEARCWLVFHLVFVPCAFWLIRWKSIVNFGELVKSGELTKYGEMNICKNLLMTSDVTPLSCHVQSHNH